MHAACHISSDLDEIDVGGELRARSFQRVYAIYRYVYYAICRYIHNRYIHIHAIIISSHLALYTYACRMPYIV